MINFLSKKKRKKKLTPILVRIFQILRNTFAQRINNIIAIHIFQCSNKITISPLFDTTPACVRKIYLSGKALLYTPLHCHKFFPQTAIKQRAQENFPNFANVSSAKTAYIYIYNTQPSALFIVCPALADVIPVHAYIFYLIYPLLFRSIYNAHETRALALFHLAVSDDPDIVSRRRDVLSSSSLSLSPSLLLSYTREILLHRR